MSEPTGPTPAAPDWRHYAEDTLPALLQRALLVFTEQGYHGTTIRQLAAGTGLSVPGLYHHYPSKQALLVAICANGMTDLWTRSQAALAEAGDDVSSRLDRLIECLVLFHAHRREVAFIAATEIRSLQDHEREAHIAARDRQQRLMDEIIRHGVDDGRFSTPYPREASRAIVTMCTGVAQWYRPDGQLTPAELADQYRAISRMTVGAHIASASRHQP